jgi:phosphate transport system substrate-binding protein
VTAAIVLTLVALTGHAQVVKVDPAIPAYTPEATVSGNLNSVGSDTMNNLMTLWPRVREVPPGVRSRSRQGFDGAQALISGTAQVGPMSRGMKDTEVDAVEAKYGFPPTEIVTSIDVLAVYVNKDNPLTSLSLPEVDAVFSKTRKGGFANNVTTWGQLGVKGEWASKPLSLYGRNSASGTYGFFKENALYKGDYKDTVKEQPGSASVVQGVTEDLYGIGYSGIGYKTSGVRALPLAAKLGATAYEPNYENALSKKYPLSRALYAYAVRDPRKPMDNLTREFLRFVLSRQGQEIVIKDGYLPLTAEMVEKELSKLK